MDNGKKRPDVAVFIDFENIYVSVREKFDAQPNFELIMDRCEDYGRIVLARAYADWYRYPRVTSALFANGVEPMYVPTYYYDREAGRTGRPIKNSVDIHLCIDVMRTLYTQSHIDKFILVTGDRDFIPLVNAVRQHGKEVIVIGIGGTASAHLAQSSDEFLFYEQIADLKSPQQRAESAKSERQERREKAEKAERGDGNGKIEQRREKAEKAERAAEPPVEAAEAPARNPFDTLVEAIHLARQRGFVSNLGSLKVLMRELDSGFNESKIRDRHGRPFSKFKDFVKEAERQGKVQIFTNGTVTEVFLPDEDPFKLSQFAEDLASEQAERELERELEREQERVEEREVAPPASSAAPAPSPAPVEPAAEEAPLAEEADTGRAVFQEREWTIFRNAMLQFQDPVRFADIFTMLRGLRNQEVLDLTNNELKELVKQAINRGMLQRTGRGARAYYRLSSQYRTAEETPAEQPPVRQPAAEVESAAGLSANGLAPALEHQTRDQDLLAPVAEPGSAAADDHAQAATAMDAATAAAPELTDVVATQAETQTAEAPPAKPRRHRRKKAAATAAEADPSPAEAQAVMSAPASAETPPAASTPPATDSSMASAAAPPAEQPPVAAASDDSTAAATKKRRSRRKKAQPPAGDEATETPGEST
ncbi:NYN domain-containing protein [Kallotenue papyrolyticum]|uniref:NYN domain-containing protein n=1 Tax=Kallotenue papyrolyticum TaxID=1325125 RepID=UPI000478545D|nr:NYN domain-containing protein [Kallotenue papyrolyticum]